MHTFVYKCLQFKNTKRNTAYRVDVFQLIKIWQFLLYALCQVNKPRLQRKNNKPKLTQFLQTLRSESSQATWTCVTFIML